MRFVYLGRMLTMDGLLCLWVVTAWASAQWALRGTRLRRGWWLCSAAACALGVLTKGPVALALVTAPVFACQLLYRRTSRPRWGAWLSYLALAAGVAAPWYGVVGLDYAGFALAVIGPATTDPRRRGRSRGIVDGTTRSR